MKRKFLWILLLISTGFTSHAQLTFGIDVGLNANNISSSVSSELHDYDFPTKTKFGLNIGIIAQYALNDQMGIQSGLYYTQKGYQIDWDEFLKKNNMEGKVDGFWRYNYNYLELPVNFYYKTGQFQITAGPYLAYGIGGKSKLDATYTIDGNSDSINDEIDLVAVTNGVKSEDFFDGDDNEFLKSYNAFDYGLNFGIGYQFNQFLIQTKYSIGLKNITPKITDYDDFDPNDLKQTHKGFSLSVSYLFTK